MSFFDRLFTPRRVSIEVDPSDAEAEKTIQDALAKMGYTLVETTKEERATVMVFLRK